MVVENTRFLVLLTWTFDHQGSGGSAGRFRDGKASLWEGGQASLRLLEWPRTVGSVEMTSVYEDFYAALLLDGSKIPQIGLWMGVDSRGSKANFLVEITILTVLLFLDTTILFFCRQQGKWKSIFVHIATERLFDVPCFCYF